MMVGQLYKPGQTPVVVSPTNGTDFSLEELYELLECSTIEVVYSPDGQKLMICDEDGKLAGKDYNHYATLQYWNYPNDYLVGNIIYCGQDMLK